MINNEITLNDLAVMVKEGFDGVDLRLDKIESDLGEVKIDLTEVKFKLDNKANKIDLLETNQRLGIVENKLGI